MPIRIVAVGKKHEPWMLEGIERYQTRLRRPFDVTWELLPHSSLQEKAARQDESQRLLSRVNDQDFVILLDERGELCDSPTFSQKLLTPLESSRRVVIIIGGAYGVTADVHQRANLVWSLSPLVFPHQLVRLMLIEQVYRAQEIVADRGYHHE